MDTVQEQMGIIMMADLLAERHIPVAVSSLLEVILLLLRDILRGAHGKLAPLTKGSTNL